MRKRVLSILLVLCMVLAVLPGKAWAAEDEDDTAASTPADASGEVPDTGAPPIEKTAPTVKVDPDSIPAGTQKVDVYLYCTTDGVELDWRPLERIYYGDQEDASAVSQYIVTNAAEVGLELTGASVDWDNETADAVNFDAYHYVLYPEGVCPVSNLVLTFEGEAAAGELTIQLMGGMFVQLVPETDNTILTQASADIFYPVEVSISIQGGDSQDNTEMESVPVTVEHEDNSTLLAAVEDIPEALIASGEPVLIPAYGSGNNNLSYVAVELSHQAVGNLYSGSVPVQVHTDMGAVLLTEEAVSSIWEQLAPNEPAELTISWNADAVRMAKGLVSEAAAYDVELTGLDISRLSDEGRVVIAVPTEINSAAVFYAAADGSYTRLESSQTANIVFFATNHLSTFVIVPKSEAEKLTAAPEETAEPEEDAEPVEPEETAEPEDTSEPETMPFTDVAENAWYYNEVLYAYTHKMMNGDGSPTLFNPDGTTTRAMLVTILYRLEGEPEAGASAFPDVPEGQWYTAAVSWAAEQGIVGGSDGRFNPMGAITRQDFATILYRYARDFKGYDTASRADLDAFPDAGSVAGYALDAMSWANAAGLINGSSGMLDPTGSAVRSQAAAILARFCENAAE